MSAVLRTSPEPFHVLVADDQPAITDALRLLLKANGISAEVASSPDEVLRHLDKRQFDLLIMDMNYGRDTTSGKEGLELVQSVRAMDPEISIVVMTAWSTVEIAVAALQQGAADFIQKPWDNAAALQLIQKQAQKTREQRRQQSVAKYTESDAVEVQRALLGAALQHYGEFTVAATTRSAKIIGGDYYDSFAIGSGNSGNFAVCIADCMGKGTAAALVMANLQAQLRYASGRDGKGALPANVCGELNRRICESGSGRLITLFYGVMESASHKLRFTNAGHIPPVLVRANGDLHRLSSEDALLGAFPSWEYHTGEVDFFAGDRLVLVTDGLLEAANAAGDEFGEEGVVDCARENALQEPRLSTSAFLDSIFTAALKHGAGRFDDDATALVLGMESSGMETVGLEA